MSVATFAALQVLRALPRTRVSRAVGRLCDAPLPPMVAKAVVRLYSRAYRVNVEECVATGRPYESFDAFFTRSLREGARAICENADHVASPSDGRIEAIGTIDAGGRLLIKKRPYTVAELIGDEGDAHRYQNGHFAVVYLSPRDYHRVHAPVSGQIKLVRSMPGDLFPVNAIGERHVRSLFARNRRVAILIDTPRLGRVSVVMVGAIIVGRITVGAIDADDVPIGNRVVDPPRQVEKGDEIGAFHLGSTAIVFVEPGAAAPFRRGIGRVLMGQSLAEAP